MRTLRREGSRGESEVLRPTHRSIDGSTVDRIEESAAIIAACTGRATRLCVPCLAVECSIPASRISEAIEHTAGFIALRRGPGCCVRCNAATAVLWIK